MEPKIIKTSLDSLPFGDENSFPSKDEPIRHTPIPEGLTGKMIYQDVIRIAWPAFLELVLTQLTSMADQMMVGRLPGEIGVQALSAVGLCAQPKFLLMTMMIALNTGSTAMVARFRGQGNRERANQTFRQSILLNILISALMTILGLLFIRPMILLISGGGISEETIQYAVEYFRIQLYGFVPLCITFTITAVLRGIGDTRTPLIYNTLSNIVNLIFNYLLIYGKFGFPEMQVLGASLATVIGQMVAFVIAVGFSLNKKRYIYISFREKFKIDFEILANVVKIGIPSMIEQVFLRVGMIIYTRTVAGLGDVSYATHQICMNIQSLSYMIGQAFANSATTLMGQSLGKRRLDMAELFTRYTRRIGLLSSVIVGILFAVFRAQIVGAYNDTLEVISSGSEILLLVALMQPVQTSQFVVAGALRGAGDTKFTAVAMFSTVLILRSVLSVTLVSVLHFGLWGAWIALAVDQCVRSVMIAVHFQRGKWRFLRFEKA